ncbi:MAG TPA: SgcJ/EcaC family oxidoreductase [Terriglobales bacterium]|jgi:uncharacterized protein (TIGR02246 family)|nr:SgcJ/EcaC family oxidoreductase [Terriglobales bacterium]
MTTPGTQDAEAIIRKTGEEWARNWNAKDLAKVVEAYAEDAVYLPPHHAAVHGRAAIREYLKAPLSHGVTELKFEVTYIRQEGNLAYDVGRYTMSIPEDGGRKQDRGKYLTVWKRQGDGAWKIAADAWSSDLPAGH